MGNNCSCWKNDNANQLELKNNLSHPKKFNIELLKQKEPQIIKI